MKDYSRSQYDLRWGQGVWYASSKQSAQKSDFQRESRWGRDVLVYGEENLKNTDPVLQFLAREGKAKTLHYYKEGCMFPEIKNMCD